MLLVTLYKRNTSDSLNSSEGKSRKCCSTCFQQCHCLSTEKPVTVIKNPFPLCTIVSLCGYIHSLSWHCCSQGLYCFVCRVVTTATKANTRLWSTFFLPFANTRTEKQNNHHISSQPLVRPGAEIVEKRNQYVAYCARKETWTINHWTSRCNHIKKFTKTATKAVIDPGTVLQSSIFAKAWQD